MHTTTVRKILNLYIDGFKNMRLGKKLWAIIAIKLFIFFVVIKMLFFPNILKENFQNDSQRSEHVLNNLIKN
ncbi:MAG TPA: DUF4492 domain-containing protein [Nitratifractor sp.]|jgi:flagellar basal body-associated protein FliL|nr:DUF4492 domain-containing protein [Nitratifractor sp.]HHH20336.1 DUF4492 domain-containing protein [Nitratifractor sp.]